MGDISANLTRLMSGTIIQVLLESINKLEDKVKTISLALEQLSLEQTYLKNLVSNLLNGKNNNGGVNCDPIA